MPKRNQGYFREQRLRSIEKRRRLIKNQKYSGAYLGRWIDEPEFKSGILSKSIMGMLSLAWPKEVEIEIHADQNIQDEFYKEVKDIV